MKAYSNGITKKEFIKEIKWHQEQDAFIQGKWFEGGKGCAVGCSLASISKLKGIELSYSDFSEYPKHLGIPEWMAKLEESIFEGMQEGDAKLWPLRFSDAITEGQDLERIKTPFTCFILKENIKTMEGLEVDKNQSPDVSNAIQSSIVVNKEMIKALKNGDEHLIASAAYSAISAAGSAARSADSADSAALAALAARSAARSAALAALADYSAAALAARSAARSAYYKKLSNKLIELIEEN